MSDQDKTDQMPEAEPPTEPQPEPCSQRRLLRSRSDRCSAASPAGSASTSTSTR